MKRLCLFTLAALLLCTGAAYAQSAGSGGGAFANAYLIPTVVCQAGTFNTSGSTSCSSNGGGAKVLFGNFKVPSAPSKAGLLMASLETSILTRTQVASKNGNTSSSSATGSIVVTPHVFECPNNDCSGHSGPLVECTSNTATSPCAVFPNRVTFNERAQTLTANLLGLNCTSDLTSGVISCADPETIDLILSTTSAHAFNFLVYNLSSGVYQVQLEIGVTTTATSNSLQAGSIVNAGVGAGSLVYMIVQAQTPFDTIKLCGSTSNTGGSNSCGP